ncbi:hypothetical protein ACFQ10_53800 [Streptomyces indonesiensis]|uniref:aromatic-ring hydroxylase C-terminal domain-containing protein n=1 Tax=Streptomyces violaceusniger group TaxID=2839105 RepID=UPI003556DBA2
MAANPRLRQRAADWAGRVDIVTTEPPGVSEASRLAGTTAVPIGPDGHVAWNGSGHPPRPANESRTLTLMKLDEFGHPLLGGDPTPARSISPPTGHLTCGRTPQGRGRPIASQVQGRGEQSRMGEAQRAAPPKASLTARHGPHTPRTGGPGPRPAPRSRELPTSLTSGASGATSSPGRIH